MSTTNKTAQKNKFVTLKVGLVNPADDSGLKITRGSPMCIAANKSEVTIAVKKNAKENLQA